MKNWNNDRHEAALERREIKRLTAEKVKWAKEHPPIDTSYTDNNALSKDLSTVVDELNMRRP